MKATTMDEARRWLEEGLLAEHSKAQTMRIAKWIGHDADRFRALVEVFLNDPPTTTTIEGRDAAYVFSQRSAWVLRYAGETAPELMEPWIPVLVANLRHPGLHNAVKRNTLVVLETLEWSPDFDDELADIGFSLLADPHAPIAVRCASMSVLERICRREPGLIPELKLLIETYFEHGSAGFKSRSKKVLSRLSAMPSGSA